MPFGPDDVHIHLTCGKRPDGHWYGTLGFHIRADILRALGLHPDQRWSAPIDPVQPAWWRAQALRLMLQDTDRHRKRRSH
ncbi:hypothetical protein GCM10009839_11150 [Catenulispora yoronensis]|uniref:Uncharacterized protein n=1 Tax=Catenulispora yoronensis TaxID=450799 RepID=A0ABN2TR25_9ACTN